jgi:hypothetical protein
MISSTSYNCGLEEMMMDDGGGLFSDFVQG